MTTPCLKPFSVRCPVEVLHSAPSEYEPSLEHRWIRCSHCGLEASATSEREPGAGTPIASLAELGVLIGVPDVFSALPTTQHPEL